jgi:queuine/archaeosine tRNA-ribosyltransferase
MLASVLLEMHNTHWWLGFFAALREAVKGGRLGEYGEWWERRRGEWEEEQEQLLMKQL